MFIANTMNDKLSQMFSEPPSTSCLESHTTTCEDFSSSLSNTAVQVSDVLQLQQGSCDCANTTTSDCQTTDIQLPLVKTKTDVVAGDGYVGGPPEQNQTYKNTFAMPHGNQVQHHHDHLTVTEQLTLEQELDELQQEWNVSQEEWDAAESLQKMTEQSTKISSEDWEADLCQMLGLQPGDSCCTVQSSWPETLNGRPLRLLAPKPPPGTITIVIRTPTYVSPPTKFNVFARRVSDATEASASENVKDEQGETSGTDKATQQLQSSGGSSKRHLEQPQQSDSEDAAKRRRRWCWRCLECSESFADYNVYMQHVADHNQRLGRCSACLQSLHSDDSPDVHACPAAISHAAEAESQHCTRCGAVLNRKTRSRRTAFLCHACDGRSGSNRSTSAASSSCASSASPTQSDRPTAASTDGALLHCSYCTRNFWRRCNYTRHLSKIHGIAAPKRRSPAASVAAVNDDERQRSLN